LLSDVKPQQESESDQHSEETFIDALTLGLRHETTDVFLAVPASDLTLCVRRNSQSEVWDVRSGILPENRPDKPFGMGWSSNLAAHIEFVTQIISPTTDPTTPDDPTKTLPDPDTVTVTDENGASYSFIIAGGGFLPMPTGRHEGAVYLSSLTRREDGKLELRRKFGSTLTYEMVPSLAAVVPADRDAYVQDSSGTPPAMVGHAYARLLTVRDRYGRGLTYSYDRDGTLIPQKIKIQQPDGAGAEINIVQTNGVVTRVYDPRGNVIDYHYSGSGGPSSNLLSVTMGSAVTQYEYFYTQEQDQTPLNRTESTGQPQNVSMPHIHNHCELAKITDPLGRPYAFSYVFDQTKFDFKTPEGYYLKTGLPMMVLRVDLPGGDVASFSTESNCSLVGVANSSDAAFQGERRNSVVDAAGNLRTYDFTDATVEIVKMASYSRSGQAIVVYKGMTITSYTGSGDDKSVLGTESYAFDITAGMALSSAIDFSGNATSYAHGDAVANPPYLGVGVHEGVFAYYDDPTSQTNALGGHKQFTYGPYRIMTSSTDEAGVKTQWMVDDFGCRSEETVFLANSTTAVKDTTFAYGNMDFHNFMTRKTVKTLSGAADPAWVTDIVTIYVPDANGRIYQEIVDPDGLHLVTTYTYDANGNKLTSTDPRGNVTTFSYDQRNRLISVTYADNSQKQFFYDLRGNKTEAIDENGVATFWQYDVLNRVTAQIVDMDGSLKTAAAATNVLTASAANYRSTNLHLVTSYTYNALNAKLTVTDPRGTVTQFEYDSLQRLKKKTEDYGSSDAGHFNYVTTYDYDVTKNCGGNIFDSSGFKPTGMTDARNYHTNVAYDQLYRPITEAVEYSAGLYATTSKSYDAVGNLLTVTDPLGTVTQTTYDALRRPLTVTEAYGTAFAATTTKDYASTGLVWRITDPLTRVTTTDYDAAGRPVKVFAPGVDDALTTATTLVNPVIETRYDAASNVIATINPLGARTDYTYDARNRRVTEQLPAVLDATTGQTVRPTRTTTYDLVGSAITVQDARGNITETAYDNARRPRAVTAPAITLMDGTVVHPVTTTTYDTAGNALTVTDANGHVTTNVYDALNRLHVTTDAEAITVTNAYDAAGNRTDVWDGLNQHTRFTYDGLKRNTAIIDPANHTVTFTYDALNKTDRVDALNQRTSYTYDTRHRLTGVTYVGRTIDNRSYVYDADNELLSVTESGKSPQADVAYTYDALGRQLTETSGGLTHTYAYDLAGNRITVTYGGTGTVLTSSYDVLNRLSTLSETPALGSQLSTLSYPRVTTYGYDLNGNRVLQQMPNGETVTTQFDALNRQAAETTAQSTGTLVLQLTQVYDLAGNIKRITENYPGSTLAARIVTNTYDDINRLVGETAVQGATTTATAYVFDAAHNRTQKAVSTNTGTTVGTTYTYNTLNQLVSSVTGSTTTVYTYDMNGNRATMVVGGLTDAYGYDYENRLVTLAKNTVGGVGTYAYAYDYRTRRVTREETIGATTTVTKSVFSGGVSVSEYSAADLSTLNSQLSASAEYIRGSDWGGGVGGLLYSVRAGVPSFDHYNSRGDVITQTDSTGAATWQGSYEAFGTRTQEVGSTQDRQKANTKEEDPTGLLNEGFRYRDLATGAFITRDPLGFVDGPNMYAYVVQNPWSKFDPEGLSADDEAAAKAAAEAAAKAAAEAAAKQKEAAAAAEASPKTAPPAPPAPSASIPNPTPPNPPPFPVPNGGDGNKWKWNPNPNYDPNKLGSRPGSYGPERPIPGQSQPRASWDVVTPNPHWDESDGLGKTTRRDNTGKPISAEEAHGRPPKQEPSPAQKPPASDQQPGIKPPPVPVPKIKAPFFELPNINLLIPLPILQQQIDQMLPHRLGDGRDNA
jgi:RHS repeat-associated protein